MIKSSSFVSILFVLFLTFSCNNEKSLQKYLVETSGKEGFMTGDFPISSLISPKAGVSDEIKETMNSVKKINVVFLKKTAGNTAIFDEEKNTLKNIFSNKNYKSLGKMKVKGMNISVYYTGETDSLDEVIAFGYSNEVGVGVARLLGENMNPVKMLEMINSITMDDDNMKNIGNIFKD